MSKPNEEAINFVSNGRQLSNYARSYQFRNVTVTLQWPTDEEGEDRMTEQPNRTAKFPLVLTNFELMSAAKEDAVLTE